MGAEVYGSQWDQQQQDTGTVPQQSTQDTTTTGTLNSAQGSQEALPPTEELDQEMGDAAADASGAEGAAGILAKAEPASPTDEQIAPPPPAWASPAATEQASPQASPPVTDHEADDQEQRSSEQGEAQSPTSLSHAQLQEALASRMASGMAKTSIGPAEEASPPSSLSDSRKR